VLFKKLARIREFHAPAAPLKKIRPAPLLELAYVKRNGRLAEMENFGRAREILQTRAFEKNFKPVGIHLVWYFMVIRELLATITNINKQIKNLYWTAPLICY